MKRSVFHRLLRSLIRDLIVPWLISAVLICAFLFLVLAFGLIAWPIAFCIFLFVCVMHAKERDAAFAAASAANAVPEPSTPSGD